MTSRQEAIRQGKNKYDSSKPCPRGHIAKRYVKSGSCTVCHVGFYAEEHWKRHDRVAYQSGYYKNRRDTIPEVLIHERSKRRAKKLGIQYTLTPDYIKSIMPVDGICPVLGSKMEISKRGTHGYTMNSPSLDRIIPSKGYIPGNVVIMSMRANLIKNNETDPIVFRKVADWLETVTR